MSKQQPDDRFQIRLSAQEAKELAKQPNARKRSRKPQEGGGGGWKLDWVSLMWSMVAFLGFLGIVLTYLHFTGQDRVIKPMEAGLVTLNTDNTEVADEVRTIQQQWNRGELNEAVASINMLWDRVADDTPQLARELALLKLKAYVVMGEYKVGNRYALTLMQRYRDQEYMTAEIFWYRGHIYYYLQSYYEAMNAFGQVVELGGTHAIEAQRYQDEISEVVSDDLFWF
jgi:hypothetical protein